MQYWLHSYYPVGHYSSLIFISSTSSLFYASPSHWGHLMQMRLCVDFSCCRAIATSSARGVPGGSSFRELWVAYCYLEAFGGFGCPWQPLICCWRLFYSFDPRWLPPLSRLGLHHMKGLFVFISLEHFTRHLSCTSARLVVSAGPWCLNLHRNSLGLCIWKSSSRCRRYGFNCPYLSKSRLSTQTCSVRHPWAAHWDRVLLMWKVHWARTRSWYLLLACWTCWRSRCICPS